MVIDTVNEIAMKTLFSGVKLSRKRKRNYRQYRVVFFGVFN